MKVKKKSTVNLISPQQSCIFKYTKGLSVSKSFVVGHTKYFFLHVLFNSQYSCKIPQWCNILRKSLVVFSGNVNTTNGHLNVNAEWTTYHHLLGEGWSGNGARDCEVISVTDAARIQNEFNILYPSNKKLRCNSTILMCWMKNTIKVITFIFNLQD